MTEQQLKRIHPLDIPLEVFLADLPTRPCRIIKAEMAYFTHSGDEYIKPPFTVRHLLMFSRKEIRDWPNMGKKSLNEIEEWLRNIGLQLWEQHDERSLKLLRDHPMYYAAPAAEEAPGQKPSAWKHDCAALCTNDVELWVDRCPHCGKPRQPATHGEPVAKRVATSTGFIDERFGPELNWHKPWANFPKGTNFYTSPQPTPELVQAAKLALNALNPRPGMPNPEYESPVACAIDALQNALKGTT